MYRIVITLFLVTAFLNTEAYSKQAKVVKKRRPAQNIVFKEYSAYIKMFNSELDVVKSKTDQADEKTSKIKKRIYDKTTELVKKQLDTISITKSKRILFETSQESDLSIETKKIIALSSVLEFTYSYILEGKFLLEGCKLFNHDLSLYLGQEQPVDIEYAYTYANRISALLCKL